MCMLRSMMLTDLCYVFKAMDALSACVSTRIAPPVHSGTELLQLISAKTRLLPTGCDRYCGPSGCVHPADLLTGDRFIVHCMS